MNKKVLEYHLPNFVKVNKIIENYKDSNMNKKLLSFKLKSYYNLNENERKHILYWIE